MHHVIGVIVNYSGLAIYHAKFENLKIDLVQCCPCIIMGLLMASSMELSYGTKLTYVWLVMLFEVKQD